MCSQSSWWYGIRSQRKRETSVTPFNFCCTLYSAWIRECYHVSIVTVSRFAAFSLTFVHIVSFTLSKPALHLNVALGSGPLCSVDSNVTLKQFGWTVGSPSMLSSPSHTLFLVMVRTVRKQTCSSIFQRHCKTALQEKKKRKKEKGIHTFPPPYCFGRSLSSQCGLSASIITQHKLLLLHRPGF